MFNLELYGIALVPVLIGIIQLLKKAGLNSRYAGVVSLGLGIVLAMAYGLTEAGWSVFQSLVIGSALGLSASGVYSTQSSLRQTKIKVQKD